MNRETKRQLLHIIVGLCALAVLLLFGRGVLMGMSFCILLAGLLAVNQAFLGHHIRLIDWFLNSFERTHLRFPGWGSACYATGVLLLSAFLNDPNQIAAGLIILALGDGVATLIGQYGVLKLPYNHKKTIEGTVAFFLSSLVGGIFIGPLIIPVAFLAAFVESLPIKFDDNLSVPIVITAFFLIFGGGG